MSQKPKFTSGPWKSVLYANRQVIEAHHNNKFAVTVCADVYSNADAHLIAAAPDLYEALETVYEEYRVDNCHSGKWDVETDELIEYSENCLLCKIEAALKKARGV